MSEETKQRIAELEAQKLAALRCDKYYLASLLRDEINLLKDGDVATKRAAAQVVKAT